MDLGLRWEYYDPIVGLAGKGSLSNYDPATNSLLVSGYGDVADDFGIKKDFNNFNPRVGASYRIDDRTVVRGGFGASGRSLSAIAPALPPSPRGPLDGFGGRHPAAPVVRDDVGAVLVEGQGSPLRSDPADAGPEGP